MSAHPLPLPDRETSLFTARITAANGEAFELWGQPGPARPAFSCLVQPQVGDLALCGRSDDGVHIVAIIERPGSQDLTMSFPGKALLTAQQGSVAVASPSVCLTAEKLICVSEDAVHRSHKALVDFEQTTARGDTISATFNTVNLVSRLINTMAKNLVQRCQMYVRKSEDLDQISAGQMKRTTDGAYSLDTRTTVMISKQETKIDGERIFVA